MTEGVKLTRLLSAFLAYQAAAIIFYGRTLLFHFADYHAGSGPDPQFMLWSVAWWPYALSHHVNPLFSKLVWAPEGFGVVWSTSINLQSILVAPVTIRFGPVAGLNLLALTMPALTALAAFVLAWRLVGKTGPAWLGGYLYGFSPFMVGHQAGAHIGLTSAFMIPAIILLTLRRIEGRVGAIAFVVGLAVLFVCQFLMGLELLGTIGLFGATALGSAWLIWPERRACLQSTVGLIALALLLTAFLLSPLLIHVLAVSGMGRHRVWADSGADLFELIVPGHFFLLGGLFEPGRDVVSRHFTRDVGGYVGLPLILVAVSFFHTRRDARRERFLLVMLAVVYVAALGPSLHFRGVELCPMPWKLFDKLPLINSAQAVRFTIYVHLLLALVVTLWIADTTLRIAAKWGIAALIVVSLLPNLLDESLWAADLETPAFFTTSAVRDNLRPGENVILLPYSTNGQCMIWQALSGMYFAMAEGGGNGPTPPGFAAWPIMAMFNRGVSLPQADQQFLAFLAAYHVSAVIIDQRDPLIARWLALMDARTTQVMKIDGVIVARPSVEALAPYRDATAIGMRRQMDASSPPPARGR